MALENAAFVDGLVIENPSGSDTIAQGDDHIRLIKKVLKATFPDADTAQSLFPSSGFYASLAGGTLANGTTAVMPFSTQVFDLNSEYDTSPYRFTPTNAGYYWMFFSLTVTSPYSVSQYGKMLQCGLYKDGSEAHYLHLNMFPYNANNELSSAVAAIVYSDGSNYWEAKAYQNSGSTVTTSGGAASAFTAVRVA